MARKSKIETEKQADYGVATESGVIPAARKPRQKKETPRKKAPRATKPRARKSPPGATVPEPSDDEIRLRAYFIAERRAQLSLQGDSTHDWIEARRQLMEEAGRSVT